MQRSGFRSLADSPDMGLDTKRVAVLDEWHFDPDVLPLATQLLWFEGKIVPITLPQNIVGESGHLEYTGDAPILITAPEEALHGLSGHGIAPPNGHWRMLRRHLKLFHFTVPIPDGHVLSSRSRDPREEVKLFP